jgi:preprotein translocase subunit Sec61beta
MFVMSGLTFSLVTIMVNFFAYMNDGSLSITPAIEVIVFLAITILLTAINFRQLAFWT